MSFEMKSVDDYNVIHIFGIFLHHYIIIYLYHILDNHQFTSINIQAIHIATLFRFTETELAEI